MTATQVQGETTVEAWRAGAARLLAVGDVSNLITTVLNPCVLVEEWLAQFSPRGLGRKFDDIRDVVGTIFPYELARRWPLKMDLYERYLVRHDRAQRWTRNRSAWGTYFERLVRFPPDGTNQLDRAIEKLKTWTVRSTTGLVFHLSSPVIDPPRTRGGPCWQFAEIIWNADHSLDLIVVYRNHDFFNKALGNFIGLGQLLQFICQQSAKTPGKLVCHSVHAYTSTIGRLRQLVS